MIVHSNGPIIIKLGLFRAKSRTSTYKNILKKLIVIHV